MDFHEKLRRLTDLGLWSKAEVSRRAGLPSTAVNDLLSKKQIPGVDKAAALARVLGVSLDWLTDDSLGWPPLPHHREVMDLVGADTWSTATSLAERGLGYKEVLAAALINYVAALRHDSDSGDPTTEIEEHAMRAHQRVLLRMADALREQHYARELLMRMDEQQVRIESRAKDLISESGELKGQLERAAVSSDWRLKDRVAKRVSEILARLSKYASELDEMQLNCDRLNFDGRLAANLGTLLSRVSSTRSLIGSWLETFKKLQSEILSNQEERRPTRAINLDDDDDLEDDSESPSLRKLKRQAEKRAERRAAKDDDDKKSKTG